MNRLRGIEHSQEGLPARVFSVKDAEISMVRDGRLVKRSKTCKHVAVYLVHDEAAVDGMLSAVLGIDVGRRGAIAETRIGSDFVPTNIADDLADLT